MKTARVCEKWDLNFNFELKSEGDRNQHDRSYLHFAAQKPDLVACKSYATEWLLKNIIDESKEYSVMEYMAGVGIQTLLIQKTFKIKNHVVNELDEGCVDHLKNTNFDTTPLVTGEDAKVLLSIDNTADLKFLDFPSSSIIRTTREWKEGFAKMFESEPKLIVWTDTSVTYPMKLHGNRYAKIMGVESINSKEEYVQSYSDWLYRTHRYSIVKAAFRHKNAVYFAAIKGKHETQMKEFKLGDTLDGFYFLDEKRISLAEFM